MTSTHKNRLRVFALMRKGEKFVRERDALLDEARDHQMRADWDKVMCSTLRKIDNVGHALLADEVEPVRLPAFWEPVLWALIGRTLPTNRREQLSCGGKK